MDIHTNIKINLKLICIVIASIILIPISIAYVLAIGVSAPYWDTNPLNMYPGQTEEIIFTLTELPDAEISNVIVSLGRGFEIAEIISGSEYTVYPGTADTNIILRVSIPKNAAIGDKYKVSILVQPTPPKTPGNVQIATEYDVNFPVKVIEKLKEPIPEISEIETRKGKSLILFIMSLFIIIVILVITVIIIKDRNRKIGFQSTTK